MSEHDQANNLVIEARDLSKTYQDGKLKVEVLTGVNLTVSSAETIAIIGVSGSGKSTLLHLLGGLDVPTGGELTLCGKSVAKMSGRARGLLRNYAVGMVYQFHHLLPEFSALENVAIPAVIAGDSVEQAQAKAAELLKRVGLGQRLQHKPGELSGGERQRTAIARALVNKPRVVLADEPTGNLDAATADETWGLMRELNKEFATAFVVVTHASELAAQMDKSYELKEGHLTEVSI